MHPCLAHTQATLYGPLRQRGERGKPAWPARLVNLKFFIFLNVTIMTDTNQSMSLYVLSSRLRGFARIISANICVICGKSDQNDWEKILSPFA